MIPITVSEGKFRMMKPCRSVQGNFILVGAIVSGVGVYPKRLKPDATRDDMRRAYAMLREQIHKEHPGIKEEFTVMRPSTHYN
jgi:hypothetical protein